MSKYAFTALKVYCLLLPYVGVLSALAAGNSRPAERERLSRFKLLVAARTYIMNSESPYCLLLPQVGVFAALAAGNSGPAEKNAGFASLANASPFYLTVGARSVTPNY